MFSMARMLLTVTSTCRQGARDASLAQDQELCNQLWCKL